MQSEQDNSSGYEQLTQLLNEEIELLEGVNDAESAAAAIAPLKETMKKQSNLSSILPDTQAFSLYVLRTESRKSEVNHILLALCAQKQRLIKAHCFGQDELQQLLKAQH